MQEFVLENKIVWRRDASENISDVFYPSFSKDIAKRESFFMENFTVKFSAATIDDLNNFFLPLYAEEIMCREDFCLDKNTIAAELADKIKTSGIHYFMFIFYENTPVSAVLFSLKNNGLYVGYRALKRDFDKNLSHKATVGYWGEKLIFDYGKKLGVEFFSYGKDSNPYIGRSRIGLPLYKIKTGMRPKKPLATTPFTTAVFTADFFTKKAEPALFFSEADADGFYKKCYLYYPSGSLNDSYLGEFKKVLDWAGLTFIPISF